MTKFRSELLTTVLDIAAFFFVTTDLYGRWLDIADAAVHDPKMQPSVDKLFEIGEQTMRFTNQTLLAMILILERYTYDNLPLKGNMLWIGVALFLAARGLSLYRAYLDDTPPPHGGNQQAVGNQPVGVH